MWNHLTFKNTLRCIDIVQALVSTYNGTYCCIIKMAPSSENKQNEMELYTRLYRHIDKAMQKFNVGDSVRIFKVKKHFEKGQLPNWMMEIFRVSKITDKHNTIMYKIKDWNGEELKGVFYP